MTPPSPSLVLFERLVHTYHPEYDTENIQGRVLTTGVKLAFGFRTHQEEADAVVQGLELEAVVAGATDLSFLILRGGNLYTGIHTVDRNLVLIATAFIEVYHREVFLIYDDIDRSLHMIPTMPRTYCHVLVAHVLVARRHDNDRSYALVFPGTEVVSLSDEGVPQWRGVLFVSPSSSTSPWQTIKSANFPSNWRSGGEGRFKADEVFSSRGRGYWVDLLCGGMYCDCSDVLSDDVNCVDIHSFDLPEACQKYFGRREDIAEARAFRAMGPVGDSIKFVSIDGYLELVALADRKVKVWRLMEDMSWAVEYELKLASIWEGLEFNGNFVPREMAPMYPFLSMREDHVIYFGLGDYIQGLKNCFPEDPCHMLRVDLHAKTFICTELSHLKRRSMVTSHLAVSRNAEGKLLGLSS